jgi:hypothetical protein
LDCRATDRSDRAQLASPSARFTQRRRTQGASKKKLCDSSLLLASRFEGIVVGPRIGFLFSLVQQKEVLEES